MGWPGWPYPEDERGGCDCHREQRLPQRRCILLGCVRRHLLERDGVHGQRQLSARGSWRQVCIVRPCAYCVLGSKMEYIIARVTEGVPINNRVDSRINPVYFPSALLPDSPITDDIIYVVSAHYRIYNG